MLAGATAPRLVAMLAVAAAAVPAGALVLVASQAELGRSPWLTAAAAASVVACVWVLAALLRASAGPPPHSS